MAQHPDWLEALLDVVAGSIESHGPQDTLGFRYGEDGGMWEVLVYPTPVELVGGELDGAIVSPGFSMDIEEVRSVLDRVVAVQWLASDLSEGSEVLIEGVYEGHKVVLRILAEAPEDEAPGMQVDVGGMDATAPEVN